VPDPQLAKLDAIIAKIGEMVDVLKLIAEIEYEGMPEDEKCHCDHVTEIIGHG